MIEHDGHVGQLLKKRNTLTWAEVDQWVRTTGNPDDYGRGYAGERLTSARNAYVEVTRRGAGERWSVTAELVLNPKLNKPALRQTWTVDEFDEVLEVRFGANHRFRIDV